MDREPDRINDDPPPGMLPDGKLNVVEEDDDDEVPELEEGVLDE